MKKRKRFISMLAIIFVLIAGITVWKCIQIVNTPLLISNDEVVEIDEGDSFYSVLQQLSTEGKIRSEFLIKLYLKITNNTPEVLEGTYVINKDMTLKELVNAFSMESEVGRSSITIPEGYTIEDIATKLAENNVCDEEEFLNAVKNYPLPSYVIDNPNKRYNLEGFLFPDTYKFEENEDPDVVIGTMLTRFEEVWKYITSSLNITVKEKDIEKVINVASIIEKEAVVNNERSMIASVIYNRLDIGMPLQIDATVIYAHGYHIPIMYEKDLDIDSTYNTYMYLGLPEGPIANPGKMSIEAALKPDDTDYIYYLLESENTHYFTDNYDDFLRRKEELGY